MIGKFLLSAATVVVGVQLQAAPGEIASGAQVSGNAAQLASMIASISGGPAVSAPAAPATSGAVSSIQKDLTDAAIMFDAALNPYATADEKSIKAALRSAAMGPMSMGKVGSSTGSSFLRTFSGKIGVDKLASIAAVAQANAEKHVASGRVQASCGSCTPNFAVCPAGFSSTQAGVCAPAASYVGYCNKPFSLAAYTQVELEEAELFCGFCFPCRGSSFLQKHGFASKAADVKNGLFLTQPMRSPAAVKVNVIEREDSGAIGAHSSEVASASQGAFLREKFIAELGQLRH